MKKKIVIAIGIAVILTAGIGAIYINSQRLIGSSETEVNATSTNTPTDTASSPTDPKQLLKNQGPAPSFTGGSPWLNSEAVKIEQLKGQVVLVNFWTYSCINCIRTFPYLTKWYEEYKDRGFTIIGVHTPEFNFEKVQGNVEAALKRYNITYPVVMDSNYKIWNAYKNQFWPAYYLLDKDGNIVYTHFGEGNYETVEKVIRTLLGMEGPFDIPVVPETNKSKTPDIYLGLTKLNAFGGTEKPNQNSQLFLYPPKLAKNKFALEGNWEFNQESAVHGRGFGRIKLNFDAAQVFMVAESPRPITIKVLVDGKLIKAVVVSASELYELYSSDASGAHTLEIEVPDAGFQAFTFTFG